MVDKITIKPANTVKAADAQEPNFPRKSRCKVHITPVVSNAGAIKVYLQTFNGYSCHFKSCKNETKAEGQDVIDETI